MDLLIFHRETGNPRQFAEKLEVSVRTLYYYLNVLRELGADIQYNSYYGSYEYLNNNRLQIGYPK